MRAPTRRAGLATGVAVALAMTTAGPATATSAVDRAAADGVDHELVAETIATSWEVTDALDRVGLTADDLVLPEREDDLYAEVAAGLEGWLAEQEPAATEPSVGAPAAQARAASEGDRLTADRLAYSWSIAEVNAARDRYAGPIESEVVYMYLSHYVDTPRGVYPGLGAHSDHSQYYAAWISDDDRRVYDQFLATNSSLGGGNALVESAKALVGLKGAFSPETLANLRDLRGALGGLYDVWDVGNGFGETVTAWRTYLGSTSEAPDRVVQSLVDGGVTGETLTERQHKAAVDVLRGIVAAAALGGGAPGVLGAVALGAAEMVHISVHTLAQKAGYAGMIASNRGRVAERMWRYLMGG